MGCRTARSAHELVRITRRADGTLVLDGPSAGRGVWVGPAAACLAAATAQLRRGLRGEVSSEAIAALVAAWEPTLAARGRVAEPPPGCLRTSGAPRRNQ